MIIARRPALGFTLVELVIVIGILGILVAVVLTVLNPARYLARARDSTRQSDIKLIQAAVEDYYSAENEYPGELSFGAAWVGYLKLVPQDPQGEDNSYCYEQTDSGQGYLLCAHSETGISGGSSGTCGEASYDYCVENPF